MSNKLKLINDKVSYSYVKYIKKAIICPCCRNSKMHFNKARKTWKCEECGYCLAENDYIDGYNYWYCKECTSYLNIQKGFDQIKKRHKCIVCGHINKLSLETSQKICVDCGDFIDVNKSRCIECEKTFKKKALRNVFAGLTLLAVGLAAANNNDSNEQGESQIKADDLFTNDNRSNSNEENVDIGSLSNEELESLFISARDRYYAEYEHYKKDKRLYSEKILDPDYVDYQNNYNVFYKAMTEKQRRYAEEHPEEFPIHREHGWYLPNDDD